MISGRLLPGGLGRHPTVRRQTLDGMGQYHDTWRMTDDGWRIVQRDYRMDIQQGRWGSCMPPPHPTCGGGRCTSPGRKALSMLNRHTLFILGASRGNWTCDACRAARDAPMSR